MNPQALEKLHDIWQPPPASWMPVTPAWYVLAALVGALLLWSAWRGYRRWNANAYRRAALDELTQIPVAAFDTLLKRTALAAWPRETVAPLSGVEWLAFLDHSYGGQEFSNGVGRQLPELAYRKDAEAGVDRRQLEALIRGWIERHRVRT